MTFYRDMYIKGFIEGYLFSILKSYILSGMDNAEIKKFFPEYSPDIIPEILELENCSTESIKNFYNTHDSLFSSSVLSKEATYKAIASLKKRQIEQFIETFIADATNINKYIVNSGIPIALTHECRDASDKLPTDSTESRIELANYLLSVEECDSGQLIEKIMNKAENSYELLRVKNCFLYYKDLETFAILFIDYIPEKCCWYISKEIMHENIKIIKLDNYNRFLCF